LPVSEDAEDLDGAGHAAVGCHIETLSVMF
jgi:hypothetical protein